MSNAIVAALKQDVWAMQPQAFEATQAIAASWDGKRRSSLRPDPYYPIGGVAVISVQGIMRQKPDIFTDVFGGCSTEWIACELIQAVRDPSIKQILLDINSPGGSVFGVQELAAAVRAANDKKPVYALANSVAASAAYWVASQARKVYVAPGGQVGSIGVYQVHTDWSKRNAMDGIGFTYVAAGKYKTEGNPDAPLSDEAKGHMQATVNRYYEAFIKDVAQGRCTTPEAVRSGFGQGRVHIDGAAKLSGMADAVRTFKEVLDGLREMNNQMANVRKAAALN